MNITKLAPTLTIATGLMLFASAANTADNVSVTVNANINAVCKFFTAAPVVNVTNTGIGSNIDPSSLATATGSASLVYRCSNGTTPLFAVPGTATITNGGGATMTPAISSSNTGPGSAMGMDRNQTLTVTGQIAPAGFQDAPAGAYTGSILISVAP